MTTDPNSPSDPSQASPYTPPPSAPPPMGAGDPLTGPAPAANYPPPEAPPATAPPASYAPPPEAPAAATGAAATSVSFNRAKVSTWDMGLAAAAVLYMIALVLPWASVSFGSELPGLGSGDENTNGFSSGLLTFAWILLLAAAVVALLPAFAANVKLPFPRGIALLGLTGLAALLTLLGFIDALTAPDEVATVEAMGVEVDYSAGIGAYLGFLVAIGALVLAFLISRVPRSEQLPA